MSKTVIVAIAVGVAFLVSLIVFLVLVTKRESPQQSQSTNPYPHPQRLEKLLTHEECDHLIELANTTNLHDSKVYDPDDSKVSKKVRESKQAWVKATSDPVLDKIADVAARMTDKPRDNQEDVQIVKYEPGGFYNPHYDACDGDEGHCRTFLKRGGQRYATLLVYLSDDFTGGGTHFPKLEFTAVPKKGDAIFFYSTDEQGRLFADSQHGGQPVQTGTKWIANVWVRHQTFS